MIMHSVKEIIEEMPLSEVDERNAATASQIGYYEALSRKPKGSYFVVQYQADYERGYEQGKAELPDAP